MNLASQSSFLTVGFLGTACARITWATYTPTRIYLTSRKRLKSCGVKISPLFLLSLNRSGNASLMKPSGAFLPHGSLILQDDYTEILRCLLLGVSAAA